MKRMDGPQIKKGLKTFIRHCREHPSSGDSCFMTLLCHYLREMGVSPLMK